MSQLMVFHLHPLIGDCYAEEDGDALNVVLELAASSSYMGVEATCAEVITLRIENNMLTGLGYSLNESAYGTVDGITVNMQVSAEAYEDIYYSYDSTIIPSD